MQRLHISKLKFFNFPLKTLKDVNCRIFRDKLFYNTLRYKKDFFFAANFENGAMRFSGKKNRSCAGALSKQGFLPCPSYIRNSKRRTLNRSKNRF